MKNEKRGRGLHSDLLTQYFQAEEREKTIGEILRDKNRIEEETKSDPFPLTELVVSGLRNEGVVRPTKDGDSFMGLLHKLNQEIQRLFHVPPEHTGEIREDLIDELVSDIKRHVNDPEATKPFNSGIYYRDNDSIFILFEDGSELIITKISGINRMELVNKYLLREFVSGDCRVTPDMFNLLAITGGLSGEFDYMAEPFEFAINRDFPTFGTEIFKNGEPLAIESKGSFPDPIKTPEFPEVPEIAKPFDAERYRKGGDPIEEMNDAIDLRSRRMDADTPKGTEEFEKVDLSKLWEDPVSVKDATEYMFGNIPKEKNETED